MWWSVWVFYLSSVFEWWFVGCLWVRNWIGGIELLFCLWCIDLGDVIGNCIFCFGVCCVGKLEYWIVVWV